MMKKTPLIPVLCMRSTARNTSAVLTNRNVCYRKKGPFLTLFVLITVFLLGINKNKAAESAVVPPKVERVSVEVNQAPARLRCEYEINPIGIDVLHPRLSWESGFETQTAYELEVDEVAPCHLTNVLQAKGKTIWNSGRIESRNTLNLVYAGPALTSGTVYRWRVRNWNAAGTVSDWSQPAFWVTGLFKPDDWKAQWFSTELFDKVNGAPPFLTPDDSPYARTFFTLDRLPDQALAFVNVMGYFELYVNGQKVSQEVLAPAATHYKKRSLYKVYDLAPYLRQGVNTLGLHLSRGWYTAPHYGAMRLTALARIQAEFRYADGKRNVLTNADQWECRPSDRKRLGQWVWNTMGGERVDARLADSQWSCPPQEDSSAKPLAFPSKGWQRVKMIPDLKVTAEADRTPSAQCIKEIDKVSIVRKFVNTTPEAKKPIHDDGKNETFLIDFGTNMTGWAEIEFAGFDPGCEIRMEYADRLDPWQSMNQFDQFVTAGKKNETEKFTSLFNYHGFRYVYITWPKTGRHQEKIVTARAKAIAHRFEQMGTFQCSDPLIMKMHEINLWTLQALSLGGFMSDCPHRERVGYGDGQLSIESCIMNYNMARFYAKWGRDWTDCTEPDGYIYHNAPQKYQSGGGPAWGGTTAALAWREYLYYANTPVMEELFPVTGGHIRALEGRSKDGVLRAFGGKWDFLGDWVPPERGMDTDNWPSRIAAESFNNCYMIYLRTLQAKMAAVLGKKELVLDLERKNKEQRPLVHKTYFHEKNRWYVVDEQAYYVMALLTNVVPDNLRSEIDTKLEKNILVKNKGHLDTGMLGTYFLLSYLMQQERNDLIWTIVSQKSYPGWGYMLEKGATTWWEQWNAYYSQIHSCFCSLDGWFYQGLAGIRPVENSPAFQRFIVAPAIVGDLKWAEAEYHSFYGRIFSRWERTSDGGLKMIVRVPANTSAQIEVPCAQQYTTDKSTLSAPQNLPTGIRFLRSERGKWLFDAGPGEYTFTLPGTHLTSDKNTSSIFVFPPIGQQESRITEFPTRLAENIR